MIDPDLLDTVLEGNILIVISEEGEVTFIMNDERVLNNPKQATQFTRLYLCLEEPSYVLRAVLFLEVSFVYLSTLVSDWWERVRR